MRRHQGFTLIEIMVVVTIIGIMTGLIAINAITTDPKKQLNREATRLKAVLEMAEEQALFGRVDIGVVVKDNTYSFLQYMIPMGGSSTSGSSLTSTPSNLTSTSSSLGSSSPTSNNSNSSSGISQFLSTAAPTKPQPKPEWVALAQQQFKAHKIPKQYGISLQVEDQEVDPSGGKSNSTGSSSSSTSNMNGDDKPVPSIYISPSGEITPFVMEIYLKKDSEEVTTKVSGDATGRIWIGDDNNEDNEDN